METGGCLWLYEIFEASGHCLGKLLNMEMVLAGIQGQQFHDNTGCGARIPMHRIIIKSLVCGTFSTEYPASQTSCFA